MFIEIKEVGSGDNILINTNNILFIEKADGCFGEGAVRIFISPTHSIKSQTTYNEIMELINL